MLRWLRPAAGFRAHSLDPDTVAHLARATNITDGTLKRDLNNLIVALKDAGVWGKLDQLCVAHDNATDSLLNLRGIAVGSDASVELGAPDFSLTTGFTVNGNNYITTNIDESSAASYGLYDGSIMFYSNGIKGSEITSTFSNSSVGVGTGIKNGGFPGSSWTFNLQDYSNIHSLDLSMGCIILSCDAIDNRNLLHNDSIDNVTTSTAYALLPDDFKIGNLLGTEIFNGDTVCAWGIGSSFTTAQMTAYKNAIHAYATARGFSVG